MYDERNNDRNNNHNNDNNNDRIINNLGAKMEVYHNDTRINVSDKFENSF